MFPPDQRLSPRAAIALGAGLLALTALIGMLDFLTGTEIAFSIFFLIPIGLGAWFLGAWAGYALSTVSSVAWLAAELGGGHVYSHPAFPYWNAGAGLGFFLIISMAISARRRTERRILELMNVKSEFVSMVSHELRTPLTCIKEGIDIVSDGSCGPLGDEQHEHLRTAKRNVDRLVRLLNNVLDYQKLEVRGDRRLRCDLNRLCLQAVEEYRLTASRKGLTLEAALEPDLPVVSGDPDRIVQVLGNLLSNAIHFSDVGGLRITTARVAEGVRVAVQDTGPGIAPEDLPRLFQAFSQLPPAPGKRRIGTGLGLVISRSIVEAHGGRMEVESTPGRGSTFAFVLPSGSAEAEASSPAAMGPQLSKGQRGRAQVDHERPVRELEALGGDPD
jgi:signal transduction histidine kinase